MQAISYGWLIGSYMFDTSMSFWPTIENGLNLRQSQLRLFLETGSRDGPEINGEGCEMMSRLEKD